MRMRVRRFTRLTNAFSKNVHMVALYTVWCNWMRIHKALWVTPAMAAGLTDKLMDFADIVALMDPLRPAWIGPRSIGSGKPKFQTETPPILPRCCHGCS